MHKAFWFGLIGGILGILLSLLLLAAGAVGGALGEYEEYIGLFYTLGAVGLVCSVVGIVGGLLERQKVLGGILMIGSGIIMIVFTSLFGAITFILFLVGGVLLIRDHLRERQAGAVPLFQPQPYPGQPMPYPPQNQAETVAAPGVMLYCPRCGARVEETAQRYCNACGKKLE